MRRWVRNLSMRTDLERLTSALDEIGVNYQARSLGRTTYVEIIPTTAGVFGANRAPVGSVFNIEFGAQGKFKGSTWYEIFDIEEVRAFAEDRGVC